MGSDVVEVTPGPALTAMLDLAEQKVREALAERGGDDQDEAVDDGIEAAVEWDKLDLSRWRIAELLEDSPDLFALAYRHDPRRHDDVRTLHLVCENVITDYVRAVLYERFGVEAEA